MEANLKGKTGAPPLHHSSELRHRKPWGSADDEISRAVLHSKGILKPVVEAEHKEPHHPLADTSGNKALSTISPDRSSASSSPKSFMQSVKESILGIITPLYSPLSSNDDEVKDTDQLVPQINGNVPLSEAAKKEIEDKNILLYKEALKLMKEAKYSEAEQIARHMLAAKANLGNLTLIVKISLRQENVDELINYSSQLNNYYIMNKFSEDWLKKAILEKTKNLYSAKKYSDAEKLGKFLLEIDENIENLNLMVCISDKLDHYDEEIKYLRQIIKIDSNNVDAHKVLGRTYFFTKDYVKSEEECDFLIKINANDLAPYFYKGKILSKVKKEFEESFKFYALALEYAANDSKSLIYKEIAIAYTKIGEDKQENGDEAAAKAAFEQALNAYDKIIESNPNSSYFYDKKAQVLHSLGRYDEAIIACDKALALNLLNDSAFNTKGNAYMKLAKYDEAISLYKQSISIDSKSNAPYINWGNILKEQKKYHEAKEKFQQARDLAEGRKELCTKLIAEVDELIMKEELSQESKKQESETLEAKEIIVKDEVPGLLIKSNELVAMGMKLINEGKYEEGSKLLVQAQKVLASSIAENSRLKSMVQELDQAKEDEADQETLEGRNKEKISDDENATLEAGGIEQELGGSEEAVENLPEPSILGAIDS